MPEHAVCEVRHLLRIVTSPVRRYLVSAPFKYQKGCVTTHHRGNRQIRALDFLQPIDVDFQPDYVDDGTRCRVVSKSKGRIVRVLWYSCVWHRVRQAVSE